MSQPTWKEIDLLLGELCNIRDEIWKAGLIENDTITFQRNWRQIVEIEVFIKELSTERADPIYYSEIKQ